MSIGPGLTLSIGDELSRFHGYRATRATAAASAATTVSSGTLTASSADSGVTVTLSSGTFDASIAAGHRFRLTTDALSNTVTGGTGTGSLLVTSDSSFHGAKFRLLTGTLSSSIRPGQRLLITSGVLSGESALVNEVLNTTDLEVQCPWFTDIDTAFDWSIVTDFTMQEVTIASRDSSTQITLVSPGLGANFTSQSWQVLTPQVTSVSVESTLDWPSSGRTIFGLTRYRYGSITSTALVSIRPERFHPRTGRIKVVAEGSLVEGEQFTIDDGFGTTKTFEFFKNDGWQSTARTRPIELETGDTAATVQTKVIDAINAEFSTLVASALGTDQVALWCLIPGGQGRYHATDTVANASFTTDGVRGLDHDVAVLDEVPDLSNTYSGTEQYFNSFISEMATGTDLDDLGNILGVPRILGLDDERYRDLIQRTAYLPRTTDYALEQALTALYGAGRFEIFEDLTFGSIHYPNTIFVRKDRDQTDQTGRAYMEAEVCRLRAASPTMTATLATAPIAVGGVRLAHDPVCLSHDSGETFDRSRSQNGRLVALGTGAIYNATTGRVTLSSGTFPSHIKKGDTFSWTSGLYAGSRGTVRLRDAGGAYIELTAGLNQADDPVFLAPFYKLPAAYSGGAWKITREKGLYAHYAPDSDQYYEVAGGSLVTAWGAASGGGSSTVIHANTPDEYYLQMVDDTNAHTCVHEHTARIDSSSKVWFTAHVYLFQMSNTVTTDERLQFVLRVHNADRNIIVSTGAEYDGVDMILGLVDSSAAFESGLSTLTASPSRWVTLSLYVDFGKISSSKAYAELYVDGVLASAGYTSAGTTSATKLQFGSLMTAATISNRVKWVTWDINSTKDYGNTFPAGGWSTASANPTRLTAAAAAYSATDDDTGKRKRVRVTGVTARNAGKGSALGEWEIDTYTSSTVATVRGVQKEGGMADPLNPTHFISHEIGHFVYPDSLGHQLQILNGPNAGTYSISGLIESVSQTNFSTVFGQVHTNSLFTTLAPVPTNRAVLSTALPDPADQTPMSWRIIPVFPTDASVTAERVGGATVASTTVTFTTDTPSSIGSTIAMDIDVAHTRSLYLEDMEVDDFVLEGTGASSTDGLTVSLGASALANVQVNPGMYIRISGSGLDIATSMARIASSTANDVTVDSPGFENAFSGADWKIIMRQVAEEESGALTRHGGYLADDYGYWVRRFLSAMIAAGYSINYDWLFRVTDNDEVHGLRVNEDL